MFRGALTTVGCFLVIAALAFPAGAAEKYPDRPIDFICTWGVGGGADQMARTIGRLAEKHLGVALPVSNIPGASGNTGLANLIAAKADGYAIAVYIADTLATISAGTSRYKISDFAWVVRTQVAPSFLFVKTDSPFKTIQDLLAYAKANRKIKGRGHRFRHGGRHHRPIPGQQRVQNDGSPHSQTGRAIRLDPGRSFGGAL